MQETRSSAFVSRTTSPTAPTTRPRTSARVCAYWTIPWCGRSRRASKRWRRRYGFTTLSYDTHASDNEEQSALLADEILRSAGVAADVVARIATYIRATESHAAGSPDAEVVVDVDLSILGEDPAVFARFEDEIRREYAWVDEASYAHGRAAVLRRFQERPFIYATSLFRARLEARARANIAASLNRSS